VLYQLSYRTARKRKFRRIFLIAKSNVVFLLNFGDYEKAIPSFIGLYSPHFFACVIFFPGTWAAGCILVDPNLSFRRNNLCAFSTN
jgi:hypothetical protein